MADVDNVVVLVDEVVAFDDDVETVGTTVVVECIEVVCDASVQDEITVGTEAVMAVVV